MPITSANPRIFKHFQPQTVQLGHFRSALETKFLHLYKDTFKKISKPLVSFWTSIISENIFLSHLTPKKGRIRHCLSIENEFKFFLSEVNTNEDSCTFGLLQIQLH